MESWMWNQLNQQLQQQQNFWMGMNQQLRQQGPRNVGNNFNPMMGFNNLHQQGQPGPKNSGILPLPLMGVNPWRQRQPRPRSPRNGGNFNRGMGQQHQQYRAARNLETYDFDEIKVARSSLGSFLGNIPAGMMPWKPMAGSSENTWEGESGMMDHITEPFPLPERGLASPGTSICDPESLSSSNVDASSNPDLDNATTSSDPSKCASKRKADSESILVSDDDNGDDSDVEIVTKQEIQTHSDAATAIVIKDNDSPKPRKKKKKKKKP